MEKITDPADKSTDSATALASAPASATATSGSEPVVVRLLVAPAVSNKRGTKGKGNK
jgi:hypothetical protein